MRKRGSILICVFLLLMTIGANFIAVEAANVTRKEKSYEIAVVFDNSGSMYDNESWSRAKYAMEVFAAMLNEKDVLKIYPMHPVTTDGKTKSGGSTSPIVVKSKSDISKIHNLYTPEPLGTPFSTVERAYNDIKKSSATDKWLIVLTDGKFDEISETDVADKLKSESKNVNVQYVGIGGAKDYSKYAKNNFYAEKAAKSEDLTKILSKICNRIFSRAELPASKISGNTIDIGVSMKKIIVFVQGANASIGELKNSEDQKVSELKGTRYSAKSSKISAGKVPGGSDYTNAPVDETLSGVLVTFDSCSAGTYKLDCSGSVQIFYDPYVDISITLTDENGDEISTEKKEIPSGEYTVNYAIVDGETGEPVEKTGLLGKNSKLNCTLENSKGEKTEVKNDSKIKLESDKEIYFNINGTYLDDYSISTEDNKEGFTFKVTDPLQKFEMKLDQPQKRYLKAELEDGKPITAKLTLDGKPLTDEELDKVKLDVSIPQGVEYKTEKLKGESAFRIKLKYPQGKEDKLECKDYELKLNATSTDKEGREIKAKAESKFVIKPYEDWVDYLIAGIGISAFLALLFFILSRKVFPKRIIIEKTVRFEYECERVTGQSNAVLNKKSKTLEVKSPTFNGDYIKATFKVKPVDRLGPTLFKSGERRVKVVGMSSGQAKRIKLDGTNYVKMEDSRWALESEARRRGKTEISPIEQELHNAKIFLSSDDDPEMKLQVALIHK